MSRARVRGGCGCLGCSVPLLMLAVVALIVMVLA